MGNKTVPEAILTRSDCLHESLAWLQAEVKNGFPACGQLLVYPMGTLNSGMFQASFNPSAYAPLE